MINYLSIYKFSFPFIKQEYEKVLFYSIFDDIKHILIYEESLKDIQEVETKETIKVKLIFDKGKIELFFNKNEDYYIPKFQLNLLFNKDIDNKVLLNIILIFESFGLREYIFEYDENKITTLEKFRTIDIKYLEKNFKSFNEKKLNNFLKNIDKNYLKEKLREDNIIFYSFIYLIYRSFSFYKNYLYSLQIQDDIKKLDSSDLSIDYQAIIKLSETRLQHMDDINLVTFKKYKNMLDKFFSILN